MCWRDGRWKVVLPQGERARMIDNMHQSLRHAGPEATYRSISADFWWPSLRSNCIELVRACPACAPEKYNFE